MGKKLLILGAGSYGRVAYEVAMSTEKYELVSFLDDDISKNGVVGQLCEYETYAKDYECAFIAIGNPGLRKEWFCKLKDAGYVMESLIHPMAYISQSAKISEGCIVEAYAVINTNAHLLNGVIVSAGAVINHDAQVGEFCHIDCNSVVASGKKVDEAIKVYSCEFYK